jgi:hypothetical protein
MGYRSDELRELLSVFNLDDGADGQALQALRRGFEKYRHHYFADDLRECRSPEQFDALIEDLEIFQRALGVQANIELEKVEEEKAEFEEYQDAYADHIHDEWKERWHEERASETTVRDMFSSLKSERD